MTFKTGNVFAIVLIVLCAAAWAVLTFWLGLMPAVGYYSAILAVLIFVFALFIVRGRVVLEEEGIAVYYGLQKRWFAYEAIRYVRKTRFEPMSAGMSLAVPNIAIRMKEGILSNMHFTVAVRECEAFLEALHQKRPEIEIQRKK